MDKSDTCAICSSDYVLTADKSCKLRAPELEGCLRYADGGRCSECMMGYYLDQETALCQATNMLISNCLQPNGENNCNGCAPGYALTINGDRCIPHCQQADETNCINCDVGYYLDPLTHECRRVLLDIPFCIHYQDFENCDICQQGFTLVNNICTQALLDSPVFINPVKEDNCEDYGPTLCLMCDKHHLFDAAVGECVPVAVRHDGCEYYENDGRCRICAKEFYMQRNTFNCAPLPPPAPCSCIGSTSFVLQ